MFSCERCDCSFDKGGCSVERGLSVQLEKCDCSVGNGVSV